MACFLIAPILNNRPALSGTGPTPGLRYELVAQALSKARVAGRNARDWPLDLWQGRRLKDAVVAAAEKFGDLVDAEVIEPSLGRRHARALQEALRRAFLDPSAFDLFNRQLEESRELLEDLEKALV